MNVQLGATSFSLHCEKRMVPYRWSTVMVPVISIALALFTGAVFLLFFGRDPLTIYQAMFLGAFGSTYGLSETAVKVIPLLLCGLGIALAFRMQLWNIRW